MSPAGRARVGLFGLLGAGNLGNDGSLESVLRHLRTRHPDAVVDLFCSGTEVVRARYGLPTTRLHWNRGEYETADGVRSAAVKVLGKAVDAVRTWRWVRRHDLVVVPGMGVLESTLPLRPWGFPYALLLVTAAGRLSGTRVALVSVGANAGGPALSRRVLTLAARLAGYRSYRDEPSRAALAASGLDVSGDAVYPDLVFGLPTPQGAPPEPGSVAVGVMDYHGGPDDRARADEVHAGYVEALHRCTRALLDDGHRLRLVTGDRADEVVATTLLADLRAHRPDLDPTWVVFEPVTTLEGLEQQLLQVETVVATRYHNVLTALRLGRPTVSLGYGAKNAVLMEEMGLGEFCQELATLDVDLLLEQFAELESRREQLVGDLARQDAVNARRVGEQLGVLDAFLERR